MTTKTHGAEGVYKSEYYGNVQNNNATAVVQQQEGEADFDKRVDLMKSIKFDMEIVGPLQDKCCWICNNYGDGNTNSIAMFKPCACGPAVHRTCWREWHRSSLSNKSWWSCPNCLHDFRYETLPGFDPSSAEEKEITKSFQKTLLLFYVIMFLVLALTLGLFFVIGYFGDEERFNIPIGMTYMLTSVVEGVPSSNTTKLWREDFASGETTIWPYYLFFSVVCTCTFIVTVFLISICTDKCCDEEKGVDSHGNTITRRHHTPNRSSCADQCHCRGTGCFCCWYCNSSGLGTNAGGGVDLGGGGGGSGGGGCENVDCSCLGNCCEACSECCAKVPDCCDTCGSALVGACEPSMCFEKCGQGVGCLCDALKDVDIGKCAEGDGEAVCKPGAVIPVLMVILMIIIAAIILSAICIIVYIAMTRFAAFHAEQTDAMYSKAAEEFGKIVVMGEGETIRTSDEV